MSARTSAFASLLNIPCPTRAPRTVLQPRNPPRLANQPLVRSMAGGITPQVAHSLLKGESPPTYLDVRTPAEFAAAHPPMAINIPVTLGGGVVVPAFVEDVKNAVAKDTPLLVACKSGRRSTMAIHILENAGFENLTEIEGGFDAWVSDSTLPVNSSQ